jgi:MraZ protein
MWVNVGSMLLAVGKRGLIHTYNQQRKKRDGYKTKITTRTYKTKDLAYTMASVDYFERKLDDKRRLTIPTELRNEFASGVVITRGFKNYLHLYPKAVWDEHVEPQLQGNILDEKTADLNVQFRMGKSETEPDRKQGRVSFEQHLLDWAGINRAVVAIRAGKYWRISAQ